MGVGMAFTGLAQAALDEAVAYAKDRIQGAVPIFEHKNVKLKLFRDARAGTIADGDNEALALVGARYL
jgi:alkylation response protein AidB-like acyl-CoA dehydrogenase